MNNGIYFFSGAQIKTVNKTVSKYQILKSKNKLKSKHTVKLMQFMFSNMLVMAISVFVHSVVFNTKQPRL